MSSHTRQLLALLCVLAFAQSAWAECAGWQRSAEARKACCGACQTSDQDAHHDHGATQQRADACCAKSEPRQSESPVTPPVALALGMQPEPAVAAETITNSPRLQAVDHLRTSPVPKHLLLSVFLV